MDESIQSFEPARLLFTPGERLGWIFRDRFRFLGPFTEPPPRAPTIPPEKIRRYEQAQSQVLSRMLMVAGISLGMTILCAWESAGLACLTACGGVVAAALAYMPYGLAKNDLASSRSEGSQSFASARAAWQQRRAAFEDAERKRINALPEWGAARTPPGTRRIDIVGGTLWGWEAFLTVFGASMIATRGPLTVVDLSGAAVCAELLRMASTVGVDVDMQRLPADLAGSDLLVGLDQRQLVDTLVESMHGDSSDSARAERSLDRRLLAAVCEVIGHDLTMVRLAAALRTVMGEPGQQPQLTEAERVRLADDLFSDEYRRQAHGNLRRIESYIDPLTDLGSRWQPRPHAPLTCLMMDSEARNVGSDLLTDLLVQSMIRRTLGPDVPRTLIIIGADELPRRDAERLSDLCERRDVRLVFLFRHLREASLQVVGAGAVAFMRLGNHTEATRAADFIGRHHKFLLTQLTRTLGGNETHSDGYTEGVADTESVGIGTQSTHSGTWGITPGQGGGWSHGGGRSTSHTDSRTWGTTRSWSTTRSWAEGTNWSDATSVSRVYEYAVEPTTLQHLPDHAMLLVESRPGGPALHTVECDPAIVTLPRVSLGPLPPVSPPPAFPRGAYGG